MNACNDKYSLAFLIVIFGSLSILSLLCGCGHNQCLYLDGTEFSLGGTIIWRTGKILTVNCREQATTEIHTDASTDSENNNTQAKTDIKFAIEDQKNGYNKIKNEP